MPNSDGSTKAPLMGPFRGPVLLAAFLSCEPEVLGGADASMSSAHCWALHTSCFSFSSQFMSTEQEERRRPQTG